MSLTKTSKAIRAVLLADTENFVELAMVARLSPGDNFRYKVFRGVNFDGCDLSSFDFTGSRFEGCSFIGAKLGTAIFAESKFIRSDRTKADDWILEKSNTGNLMATLSKKYCVAVNRQHTSESNAGHAKAALGPDAANWHVSPRGRDFVIHPGKKANDIYKGREAMDDGRRAAISALAGQLAVALEAVTRTRYSTVGGSHRAVVLASRNYKKTRGVNRYWYGYRESAFQFLGTSASFLVLLCTDTGAAFAIPADLLRDKLETLSRTTQSSGGFWHLEMRERHGELVLNFGDNVPPIAVRPYVLATSEGGAE